MRIAIAGKGGTGKTTIAGTLARALARRGRSVLAVDADTNPNLAGILGIDRAAAQDIVSLPLDLFEKRTDPDGTVRSVFTGDAARLIADYGAAGPDGVRLLVMGAVQHAGKGCMCRAHATVRSFVGELVERPVGDHEVIVDMEAGLEHFSRGTGRHVSGVLIAVEPYYRSMETARRVAELARELGIASVHGIANKVRDDGDREAVAAFCAAHGLELIGEVPFDATLLEAERAGAAPIDHRADAPAVRAIDAIADRLLARAA